MYPPLFADHCPENRSEAGEMSNVIQKGEDRAKFGARVLETLAAELSKKGLRGLSYRSLRLFRQFYFTYPSIWQTASAKSGKPLLPFVPSIWQAASAKSSIGAADALVVPAKKLVSNLTFSHFVELLKVDEPLKRTFYEIQSIRCNWNVNCNSPAKKNSPILSSAI
jgi:hypothetical protein